jgi:hypothetical protein
MSNEELIGLLEYCSPNILYVVSEKNKIIKLKTPFKLKVLQDVGKLKMEQVVFCTQLKITQEGKIVFCIESRNYHTHHFDIITT